MDNQNGNKKKSCGNYNCSTSSSVLDFLTFGSGELDDNGFWENPCPVCARNFEKKHPELGPCWPFDEKTCKELADSFKENKKGE